MVGQPGSALYAAFNGYTVAAKNNSSWLRYRAGANCRLFYPPPSLSHHFAVLTFGICIHIIKQYYVRPYLFIARATRALPGAQRPEGDSVLSGEFAELPGTCVFLLTIILYDAPVVFQVGLVRHQQVNGVIKAIADKEHIAFL